MEQLMDVPLGRRERKKLQTQASLESAALRLFQEKGFAHTTVEDITEAADVSPRTFFRYFESKEAVLFPTDDVMAIAFQDALASRPEGEDVLTGIRAAFALLADVQVDNRELTLIRAQISLDAPEVQAHTARATSEWEERLRSWLVSRLPSTAHPMLAEILAGACIAALRAGLGHWIASGGQADPGELVDRALDLVQGGLGQTV